MAATAREIFRVTKVSPPWGFVIEEYPVDGKHAVRFAIIARDVEGIGLGRRIGTAGVEGGRFGLWCFHDLTIHFRRGGLIKPRLQAKFPHPFENSNRSQAGNVARIFGYVEGNLHMRLGSQIVNLVRSHHFENAVDGRGVRQVAERKMQADILFVPILIDVVDPAGVEGRGASHHAPHFVATADQEFREVGAILSGDAGNQGPFSVAWWKLFRIRSHRMVPTSLGPGIAVLSVWRSSNREDKQGTRLHFRRSEFRIRSAPGIPRRAAVPFVSGS